MILCVPVRCNDRIIGALGGSYNVTALSQMLFNDIFDDAGYSLIVTKKERSSPTMVNLHIIKSHMVTIFLIFIKTEHFCPKILL